MTTSTPPTLSCLLSSSVVEYTPSGAVQPSKQLQIALVICNGITLGACPAATLQGLSEAYSSGIYTCTPGIGVDPALEHTLMITRQGNTSLYRGSVDGFVAPGAVGWQLSGFAANSVIIDEWSEVTSPYITIPCSGWQSVATFTWLRYNFSQGWRTPTSSDVLNEGCWSIGGMSGGVFNVQKL